MRSAHHPTRLARTGRQLKTIFTKLSVPTECTATRDLIREIFAPSARPDLRFTSEATASSIASIAEHEQTQTPTPAPPTRILDCVRITPPPVYSLSSPKSLHGHKFWKVTKPSQKPSQSKASRPSATVTRRHGFFGASKIKTSKRNTKKWAEFERTIIDDETDCGESDSESGGWVRKDSVLGAWFVKKDRLRGQKI